MREAACNIIGIVCTNLGAHSEVRLATVQWTADGHVGFQRDMSTGLPKRGHVEDPMLVGTPGLEELQPENASTGSYRFNCPKCRRTPTVDRRRWWRKAQAVRQGQGRPIIDVSLDL